MPTYTYECRNCGDLFDSFHSITQILTECLKCKHQALQRIIQPVAFHLHGEGFYKTDYNRIDRAKKLIERE